MKPVLAGWLCLFSVLALRAAAAEAGDTNAPAFLRPGDALLVRIANLGGELPEYREIVDSDGRIELPFLGFFSAEGKTIAATEAEMAAAYANAKLSTNATVRMEYITHFEPPPARTNLFRFQDPRRPVPAPGSGIKN